MRLYLLGISKLLNSFIWAFRLCRRAFCYIFAHFNSTSLKNYRCLLSIVCSPKKLAKDAAPIPNAAGDCMRNVYHETN